MQIEFPKKPNSLRNEMEEKKLSILREKLYCDVFFMSIQEKRVILYYTSTIKLNQLLKSQFSLE